VTKLTTEQFIERTKEVHGGRYDYSLVRYVNIDTKIKILCKKHGVFETTPYRHLKGVGCLGCNGPNYRGFLENANRQRLGKDVFVERSKKKHGDKYDYSLAEYKNNRTKVKIICPVHGLFYQTPDNHMKGVGCPGCKFDKLHEISKIAASNKNKKCARDFVQKAKKRHNNKNYDYSQAIYSTWEEKVKIICLDHGPFLIAAHNHLAGAGCPSCSDGSYQFNKPAIFYYLRINSSNCKPLYKIGITNKTVKDRYGLKSDRDKFRVLNTRKFSKGADAWALEKELKKEHSRYLYSGEPPLSRVGVSEIFVKDILNLDKEIRGVNH